ncbi:MAG: 16S rRNA (cytosine(967)-C(5))-methyltransferase RsmB, partial [Pseudomonadota bacterium]
GQLLTSPLKRKARAVHWLLLSSIQELIEQREPAPAIIHASVAASRLLKQPQLSGLVNAVLRNHQRQHAALDQQQPDRQSIRTGYPDWLIDRIAEDWPEHVDTILAQGNQTPPIWLRIHAGRNTPADYQHVLAEQSIESTLDDHQPSALRLSHAHKISALPGYAQGWFSVQDAGAQLAAELMQLAQGLRVLDACAAPGGKTAHMLERTSLTLTALEIDANRARTVEQNLERLQLTAQIVVADATQPERWWDGRRFDRILVDAPCSASGVIRRHPDIRWLRTERDIEHNVATQRALLKSLWPLLEPGGLLVYASCSILQAENCAQARWFLETHKDAELVPIDAKAHGAMDADPGMQILPGSRDRDGFYYAVFKRLPGA